MKMLSIIVPCYNEADVLDIFYNTITKELKNIEEFNTEILFVDDGSNDNTAMKIKEFAKTSENVRFIVLSRNFGKEAAMYAGMQNSTGDYVVIMDADLQDPPALIPKMLNIIEKEKVDCVGSRRVDRKGEPPIRSFFARMFYKLINGISDAEIVDGARDFQMMTRKVVDAILSMKEYNRFSKGIFGWIGFKKKWLEYENVERAAGETKWSFWKLFIYAIQGIIAFSTVPLSIAIICGILCCSLSIIMVTINVIQTFSSGFPMSQWSILMCTALLLGGIQMLLIGVLGQYIAKTYTESKRRPIYLIDETNIKLKRK